MRYLLLYLCLGCGTYSFASGAPNGAPSPFSANPLFYTSKGKIQEEKRLGQKRVYYADPSNQLMEVSQYTGEGTIVFEEGSLNSHLGISSDFYTSIRSYVWDVKELEDRIEKAVHHLFGGFFLTLSGWHIFTPEAGTYGKGEVNEKVRITMINGILNRPETCEETLELLSDAHDGTNLHYIFRPTEGWTWDLIKSLFVKFGYVSESSRLLASLWKELIEEMGGVDGGGLIIHYAHSVGGTETYAASSLLTPEERQMIRIISIGSASIIPSTLGYESVVNYASLRDGVFLLDTEGILRNLFFGEHNVIYLGDIYGIPLIDHLMTMDTYRTLIEELGQKFIEEHGMQDLE